jgi:DNA-directed RNA polymerase subunit RPC12/RpoP
MDNNTKILIPEIPGAWTERNRSGHKCIWNDGGHGRPHRNGQPYVELEAPEQGLYAERIDGAWYWVSGCNKCNGVAGKWSYIVCDEHNVCTTCGAHRSTLTETPWGTHDGFRCKPCQDRIDAEAKAEALAKVAENGYDEWDYHAQDQCKCPHCATGIYIETEDYGDKNMDCATCGGQFELTTEYSVTFTTRVIGDRVVA